MHLGSAGVSPRSSSLTRALSPERRVPARAGAGDGGAGASGRWAKAGMGAGAAGWRAGTPAGWPRLSVPLLLLLAFLLGFQLGWLATGPVLSPLPMARFSGAAGASAGAAGAGGGERVPRGGDGAEGKMAGRNHGAMSEAEMEMAVREAANLTASGDRNSAVEEWNPLDCHAGGTPSTAGSAPDQQAQGTVLWEPAKDRYLLAMCSGGQMSNRLACLRQNMLDAALMNRSLVIPTHGIDYNYEHLLDLDAMKDCFGPGRIFTLDEMLKPKGQPWRVGRVVCHVHTYQTEEVCASLVARYSKDLGLEFLKQDTAKRRTPGPWFKYPSSDFLKKFTSKQKVLAFSNMFGVGGRELRFHGTAPLVVAPTCRGFLIPSKPIQNVAVGFANMFLGTSYVAVHMRRGDFFLHCLRGPGSHRAVPCYYPVQQVARCLAARLGAVAHSPRFSPHPVSMLFLATNADDLELAALDSALASFLGRKVALVRLPSLASKVAVPWAEPLVLQGLGENAEVLSFVDKTICALAAFFFGTPGSTFSNDILRLREWWQQGSGCDAYMCPPQMHADTFPFAAAAATKKDASSS